MNKRKLTRKLITIVTANVLMISAIFVHFYMAKRNESKIQNEFTTIDDIGRTVTVPQNLQRIISLAPSVTEILFAIGLGNKVVGVDDYSDYPEAAKNITKVGSYSNPNLEAIVMLEPDVILASSMTSKEYLALLEQKKLTLYVLAPNSIQGIIRNIRIAGAIGGKAQEANDLANTLEQRIKTITSKTLDNTLYKPKVYVEYYPYWTYGPGSFGNDLIFLVGGKNIASTIVAPYSEITNEFVVACNPEIIIFTIGSRFSTTIQNIESRTGWNKIDAVKNNKIYTLDDDIISRPGPRIVDTLEQLAKLIHPELFSSK